MNYFHIKFINYELNNTFKGLVLLDPVYFCDRFLNASNLIMATLYTDSIHKKGYK